MPERAGSAIACEPGPEIGPESVLVRGLVCAAVTGWPTNKAAPSIERRRRLDETFTVSCRLQFVRDQVGIEIRQRLVPRRPEKVMGSLVTCVAGRNLCRSYSSSSHLGLNPPTGVTMSASPQCFASATSTLVPATFRALT